jgi:hypothetical protein
MKTKLTSSPNPTNFGSLRRGELFTCEGSLSKREGSDIYIKTGTISSCCNCICINDGEIGLMYDSSKCYKVDGEFNGHIV